METTQSFWLTLTLASPFDSHVECKNETLPSNLSYLPLVPGKHGVDDGEELHDSLIQVKVLQPLEEVGVLLAIRPQEDQLLRLGLGGQDVDCVDEGLYVDNLQERIHMRINLLPSVPRKISFLGLVLVGRMLTALMKDSMWTTYKKESMRINYCHWIPGRSASWAWSWWAGC